VLQLSVTAYGALVGHAYDEVPLESCGLLIGTGSRAVKYAPIPNVAQSARVYALDGRAHLRAEMAAEDDGLTVLGVVHSHTHTDPYPSPTDIASAPDPSWHYVIVSLRDGMPTLRSYRIIGGAVTEEPIELLGTT
jgi:[CysO sulfur-carrier protein]-S-L-cysteine hydrolase